MGIAMAAAAAGAQVALVDGDTQNPTLADALRLELEYGWVESIRGGLPIKEVAVHAVEDGVTLIPLMPPRSKAATATDYETSQLMELLKNRFDLVIVDGPGGPSSGLHRFAAQFDSVVIVCDDTRTDAATINEMADRFRINGVQGVGIVKNFV
jgi:Mrp family chromosome partitioning ATPase